MGRGTSVAGGGVFAEAEAALTAPLGAHEYPSTSFAGPPPQAKAWGGRRRLPAPVAPAGAVSGQVLALGSAVIGDRRAHRRLHRRHALLERGGTAADEDRHGVG